MLAADDTYYERDALETLWSDIAEHARGGARAPAEQSHKAPGDAGARDYAFRSDALSPTKAPDESARRKPPVKNAKTDKKVSSGKKASSRSASGKRAAGKRAAGKRAAGKRASGKQASGKRASSKQASGKQASGKQASGKKRAPKPRKSAPRSLSPVKPRRSASAGKENGGNKKEV